MLRKILVIAVREYNAAVRTKAFLVSLVMFPVLMLGSMGAQTLLRGTGDTKAKHFAVIDQTEGEGILAALQTAASERKEAAQGAISEYVLERVPPPQSPGELPAVRLAQSDRVRRGELAGIIEIGPNVDTAAPPAAALSPVDESEWPPQVDDGLAVRFQAHSHTAHEFTEWLHRTVSAVVRRRRCQRDGLDPVKVDEAVRPVPLKELGLSDRDPRTGQVRDGAMVNRVASFLVPAALVMLMFMMIFVGASPLMQGVVEEKSQRIAEVLLGSVRPFPLMLGKLLGTVGVATTLALIYLGGAFLAAQHFGVAEYVPGRLIAWFIVYETLGVLLFGSLFIAVGAACTSVQETQTLLMPVMVLAMTPLFVMMNVITEPDAPLATGASLFPTATPMLMIARLSVSPGLPVWQPLVGVVLVLLTTLGCVWAAGRVFRVGLLAQGKGASIRELIRWVWQG